MTALNDQTSSRRRRTDLLLISNGHGEDQVAAAITTALLAITATLEIEAYPLVGVGERLKAAGLTVRGPARTLPSGGLTLHAPQLLLRDLKAGLLPLTVAQVSYLRRQRPRAVMVVGDVYAQLHAAFVRAPRRVLQPLVSAHHFSGLSAARTPFARYFMERYRRPELWLMRAADRVYTRDAATADYLHSRGVAAATFLGNPMMDGLAATPIPAARLTATRTVALLPGSRAHAAQSLSIMLGALAEGTGLLGLVAWAQGTLPTPLEGWQAQTARADASAAWAHAGSGARVLFYEGRFAEVLATAEAAIGTAGTANEQAVGTGLPVVAFPVPPAYSSAFLENQARLLSDGLLIAGPTPAGVYRELKRALDDPLVRAKARAAGQERMGPPGGSQRIAQELASWLGAGAELSNSDKRERQR